MILQNGRILKQKPFKNEKELQKFFETNLEQLLHLEFVETEFTVGDFRLDTVAFDPESKAFCVIEYKNVQNHSLVDQGFTYLKLVHERIADFILRYNEKYPDLPNLNSASVDRHQSRIYFVAPQYTKFQLNALDFQNMPFELVKVTRYEDDIVDVDVIERHSKAKISSIYGDATQEKIAREVKVYSEEDHLSHSRDDIQELYFVLKERILELGDINVDPKKDYIAFKGITNICDVELAKNFLKISINLKKGQLKDPFHLARDVSAIGHWGNGDYQVKIANVDEIDIILPLIRQSLKVNGK